MCLCLCCVSIGVDTNIQLTNLIPIPTPRDGTLPDLGRVIPWDHPTWSGRDTPTPPPDLGWTTRSQVRSGGWFGGYPQDLPQPRFGGYPGLGGWGRFGGYPIRHPKPGTPVWGAWEG